MKIICIMATVLVFASCKSLTPESVPGLYSHTADEFYTETSFTADSFYYLKKGHLLHLESKGTWEIKGRKIVLCSNPEYKKGVYSVKELISDKPYFKVMDYKGFPVPGASIAFGNKYLVTNVEGRAYYGDTIKSFTVTHLDVSLKYHIKDTLSNSYTMKVYDAQNKVHFDNERWKLKQNGQLKAGFITLTKKPSKQ